MGRPHRHPRRRGPLEQARRLLHDHTLNPEDRVAGLLALLYTRWPSTISRRTLDHAQTSDDQVQLRHGREPVVLPEPLANLVRQLVATRRGHAAIGDQGNSRWLFPGGQPGYPISAAQLTERLRQLDIHSVRARSIALFALSTELPRHPSGPHARHPHRRRRGLATREERRLDHLRRRCQPPEKHLIRSIDAIPTHWP